MLTRSSGESPKFSVEKVDIRPDSSMVIESGEVLLASGFSSTSPDTSFPLSPTLQLNHDLAGYGEEQLERIGFAELERVNEEVFRSYTVEPDGRLCVIGNTAESLDTFINSYGGMIEIEPLLLKENHPDYSTPLELEISGREGDYQIRHSVRSPLRPERCTYCGACGPACPETCLDENLYIDFSVCTLCKECENACEFGALDIHGVEDRVLSSPAILLLDGVEIEFEGDRRGMYLEADIQDYFASQFACQVDEVVTCNSKICQYSGKYGGGCTKCVQVCTYGAIIRDRDGIRVDSLKCEECGSCIGACPTGAMQYERLNDPTFISYVAALGMSPGTTVVLADEEILHKLWWKKPEKSFEKTLFIECRKVNCLSLFHLLHLYGAGAGKIVVLGREDELGQQGALMLQSALASSLLNTYFQVSDGVVTATLAEFLEMDLTGNDYPLSEPFTADKGANRRKNLAELLRRFTVQSGRQARVKADSRLPFGVVSCDSEKCTQCYACLNECLIQALTTTEKQLALIYNPSLCVGCGVCTQVCPENALQLTGGATLDETFFETATLAEAEPMACKACGKVFGTRKSYERVMSILSQKEGVDTSHFEYCETCRVIKLFETT